MSTSRAGARIGLRGISRSFRIGVKINHGSDNSPISAPMRIVPRRPIEPAEDRRERQDAPVDPAARGVDPTLEVIRRQ